ncbi:hypothetical protein FQZ97_1198970 [compost metagenome]
MPRQPILWNSPASSTSLRLPREPSSLTRNLGTMNSEMPFTPGGASGSLASTMCTMFSDNGWSPAEMKILLPLSR